MDTFRNTLGITKNH